MSESDHFCSPPSIANALDEFFGGPVGCDPCSNPTSIIRARVAYTIGGLHLPWGNRRQAPARRTGYSNPPYSATGPWIDRGLQQFDAANVCELVYLVMAVPSTGWWRTACAYRVNPRIIVTKRLAFIDPQAPKPLPGKKPKRTDGARFETALFYYGKRHRAFDHAFAAVSSWSSWGRSVRA